MAGARIYFNDAEVMAKLGRLSALDLRKVLTNIGSYMQSVTKRRFKESTDPEGRPWLPLSQATLSQRAGGKKAYKKGGGLTKRAQGIFSNSRPLVDRGHLRDSITYRVTGDGVEIGTNMVYGAIHQFGGMAGWGRKVKIPARPFLGVSPENRAEILRIINDHVEEVLR